MIIRVLDLETTGFTPPEGAVCEIGWSDLVDGRFVSKPRAILVNPGHLIPPEASAVHHIIDDDVADAISWGEAVAAALDGFNPDIAILAAHNARFERQWLTDETTRGHRWICTYKSALRLWPDAPRHNNGTLRYWRKPPHLDRDAAALSHRAGPDAYVTAFLLAEMLELATVDDLVRWSSEPALLVKCGFGRHYGKPWSEVPSDYLSWASKQELEEDVLFTVRHELRRRAG